LTTIEIMTTASAIRTSTPIVFRMASPPIQISTVQRWPYSRVHYQPDILCQASAHGRYRHPSSTAPLVVKQHHQMSWLVRRTPITAKS
jgi:hypothetical protein